MPGRSRAPKLWPGRPPAVPERAARSGTSARGVARPATAFSSHRQGGRHPERATGGECRANGPAGATRTARRRRDPRASSRRSKRTCWRAQPTPGTTRDGSGQRPPRPRAPPAGGTKERRNRKMEGLRAEGRASAGRRTAGCSDLPRGTLTPPGLIERRGAPPALESTSPRARRAHPLRRTLPGRTLPGGPPPGNHRNTIGGQASFGRPRAQARSEASSARVSAERRVS